MPYIDGCDTAWPQGSSGGIGAFNITCATRGNVGLQVDSGYPARIANTRLRGAEGGHYHFNGMQAAVAQADYFIDHLTDFRQGDILALDSEYETGTGVSAMNPANAAAFFDRLHVRTGGYPYTGMACYINRSIRSQWDWSGVWARGVRKWIASPGVDPGDWDLWQYSEAGGIDHNYAKQTFASMIGDDMPTAQEIADAVWQYELINKGGAGIHGRAADWLTNMSDFVGQILTAQAKVIDPTMLAQELVKAGLAVTADTDKITQAIQAAILPEFQNIPPQVAALLAQKLS